MTFECIDYFKFNLEFPELNQFRKVLKCPLSKPLKFHRKSISFIFSLSQFLSINSTSFLNCLGWHGILNLTKFVFITFVVTKMKLCLKCIVLSLLNCHYRNFLTFKDFWFIYVGPPPWFCIVVKITNWHKNCLQVHFPDYCAHKFCKSSLSLVFSHLSREEVLKKNRFVNFLKNIKAELQINWTLICYVSIKKSLNQFEHISMWIFVTNYANIYDAFKEKLHGIY